MKKEISSLIGTLIFGLIYYYFFLPPINIQSIEFLIFVLLLIVVNRGIENLLSFRIIGGVIELDFNKTMKRNKVAFIVVCLIIILPIIVNIALSPIFNAKSYSKRINVITKDFKESVPAADFHKLAIVDKDSSRKLGDRVMGGMSNYVSQFDVSLEYNQINYKDEIIRVTPLEYSDFFKWLFNRKKGINAFIKVSSTSGGANLVKMDKGIKYLRSGFFNDNLKRKIRFDYPTMIFKEIYFEINDNDEPFYIIPSYKVKGFGMKKDIKGAVILNAVTGKSEYYNINEIPEWVDHVYPSYLLLEQLTDWGMYKEGFINTFIGQKNVVVPTSGYNYLAMNNDIYLYTGITSVVKDESNIGFVLVNLRTKEAGFYNVPGAEEYSAMASAEGQVQQMNYKATFPLLINLNNRPTYLMSLKDDAGLVKMYAFVDVVDYQKVVVTEANEGIIKARDNYLNNSNYISDNLKEETIIIDSITSVVIDGNSYYYLTSKNKKYKIKVDINSDLIPFLKVKDKVTIGYHNENGVIEIKSIKGI
jgi:hypothetical protein